MLAQPQQPSKSKLDVLGLKERLQKNMCPLRSSNNSPKPNLLLEKCQQRGEQQTTIEVDEKEEEDDNPLINLQKDEAHERIFTMPFSSHKATYIVPRK